MRTVNSPLRQFFGKNTLKQSLFNVLMPNLQAVFTGGFEIILLKKIRPQPPPWPHSAIGTPADLRHSVPQQADHRLHELGIREATAQWGGSFVSPLQNAANSVFQSDTVCGHPA
jgi:hypothetical protein